MHGRAESDRDDRSGLSRRAFVRNAALGGMAVAAGNGLAERGLAETSAAHRIPRFELEEMTIAAMREWMEAGRFSARYLVERYLERIDALDRSGPHTASVLETNPDALSIADRLDAERRSDRVRGPLHGIPILIKDNIATADQMQTAAGSLALLGAKPKRDSFMVEQLHRAGAIILGKTNLSEWANFRSTQSSSGWSGRGGQCKNPYALDRNPCGSSSGSGAAAAASYCAAAIGTETDGSVVCPASANSVVGIKPTVGLVSRSGIIPIAHSQDTAGPMARTVADAAALLSGMVGVDSRDGATSASRGHAQADYTRTLDAAGLKGARIGVVRERYSGFSPEADVIFEEAIAAMKDAGAEIIDPANIPSAGEFGDSEFEVLLYEFKADLNVYLADLESAPARSLEDLIAFNDANAAIEMPYFGQEIFLMAQEKGPLSDDAYKEALEKNHRLSRAEGIDKVMDEHNLDALIAPTGAPPWPIDLVNGDHYLGGSSAPAAVSGYPNITVPAGYVFGLPVGLSIFGRAWSEPKLISIAYAFERATQVRNAPRFLAAAELG